MKYGDHRAVWRGWYAPTAAIALVLAYLVGAAYFHITFALVISLYFTWLFFADRISGWLLPMGWFFAFSLAIALA